MGIISPRPTPQPAVHQGACGAVALVKDTTGASFPLGSLQAALLACLRLLNELIQNALSADPAEFSSKIFYHSVD